MVIAPHLGCRWSVLGIQKLVSSLAQAALWFRVLGLDVEGIVAPQMFLGLPPRWRLRSALG